MPTFPDQAETASNRDAEAGLLRPAELPLPTDGSGNVNGMQIGAPNADPLDDAKWMLITKQIKSAAEQNLNPLRNIWANNYRAINNQHANGSKYLGERFRGRSQLHRPKTRTALKKSDAAAANALFATSDVVSIEAANPLDEKQVASAAINKALLNHRLDRKSGKAGVPWFQVAMGAHNDSQATGICVSKQYWERREVVKSDGTVKVVRDRPMIRLYPPELVLRDPGADWLDQVQDSTFIGLMNPMTIGDWKAMAKDQQTKVSGLKYRQVDDSMLQSARIGGATQQVNTARETGGNQQRQQISVGVTDFDRFWAIEWFVRLEGIEYVYWTAGAHCLLSDPVEVEQAYPVFDGERPIVIGLGNLEPHKIDPMSMVQSILPLQMEMNDLVNMRLDGVKESIRPLTMIKRGKNIDVKAVQQRSGDTALYVDDKEDVTFDRPGNIGGEAYMEMNYLNADFDDAAGQFNGSSVATNRQLNETVGGMKLLNSSANVVNDFDNRVWIETYVEPVLRQMVRLEQYYEDDAVILTIAGQKAKLYQKYGVSTIDDELLNSELLVSVSAGIGNADPMVKLDKFLKVAGSVGTLLGEQVQSRANQDAIIDEVFGAAGFRDAAERFFHPGDQTDPRITKMQGYIGELTEQVKEKQSGYDNQLKIKQIDSATTLVKQFLDGIQKREQAETTAVQNAKTMGFQHAQERFQGKQKMEAAAAKTKPGEQAKPPAPAPDPQAEAVESDLGKFTQMMLPMLLGQVSQMPVPQQQQAAPPQLPAPMQQQQGPDPMMGQVMQALISMQQQQTQAMQAIAMAINGMGQAQRASRTVRKNPDGTMTLVQGEGAALQ